MRHYNPALFSDPPSLRTCALNTCIIFIPGFAGVSHSTETSIFDEMYLRSLHLLHAQTLISLQQFPYHKHELPIIISLDINLVRAVNVKCSTTVMLMDRSWKASFRQAVSNAGGINISHKLMFLLALAWMFLASFAVITGTIHAWYGARNLLTPNQDTSHVNVMNTKSGNRIQYTGREAAVKQYIIGEYR